MLLHWGGAARTILPEPCVVMDVFDLRPKGLQSYLNKVLCGAVHVFNHVFWFLSSQSAEVTHHMAILKEGLSSLQCWRKTGEGGQAPFPTEDWATRPGHKPSPSPRG